MIPFEPNALSPVLAFAPILCIRIDEAHPGAWRPRPEGGDVRDVDVRLRVVDVYKGESVAAGLSAQARIRQAQSASLRNPAAPGPWSAARIEAGTEHIIFCTCPDESDVAALVKEPCCAQVLPQDIAAFDMAVARDAGFGEDAHTRLLAAAFAAPARLGFLLPAYMSEAFGPRIVEDPQAFSIMARLVLARELKPIATVALIRSAMDAYERSTRPPAAASTLARVMFRLLARENAASMHANIVDTYLPSLIVGRAATEVFRNQDAERTAARAAVAQRPDAAALSHWLDGGHAALDR